MPRLSTLLIPLLAAGCTSMGAAPASPTPGGFPMNSYVTTVAESDIPASASADERAGLVGRWVLAFGSGGHALVSTGGRQVVDAPFTVSGNEVTFTEDSGEYACHSSGRYTWHATATELHLTRIEDPCAGRVVVLTAHALVRQ